MQWKAVVITGISLVGLPLVVAAANGEKPNLTGTWVLDNGKAAQVKRVIEQDGNSIHIVETATSSDGKQKSWEMKCNTVGQQCKVDGQGHPAAVSFWYNGPMLVEMDTAVQGKDKVTKRRSKLSDDGKSLEVEVIPLVPPGVAPEKLVFVKQQQ